LNDDDVTITLGPLLPRDADLEGAGEKILIRSAQADLVASEGTA
jgi:hypothetical protein